MAEAKLAIANTALERSRRPSGRSGLTEGLLEIAEDLDLLLAELRDSLARGAVGVRREVDAVLRDLELLPADLREEAGSVEDAAEKLADDLIAEAVVEADQTGAAAQLAAST